MATYEDCENWGYKLCHPTVKHLFEPGEGYTACYTTRDVEEALSICQKCPNYKPKKHKSNEPRRS
jgi:hypothetical protein